VPKQAQPQSLIERPVSLPKIGDTFQGGKVLKVEKVEDAPQSSMGH
jgi:hypothetical protein